MASPTKDVEVQESRETGLSVIEQEAEIVQARQPLSVQDRKDEKVVAQEEELRPDLPFSKARAIALVLTVTAASFLNVRLHHLCANRMKC